MSASHTNKGGARYRYYFSQAILQNRPAGSIGRVPATEIEALVIEAVRDHLRDSGIAPSSIPDEAHKLIERHVERVTLTSRNVELQLRSRGEAATAIDADDAATVAAQPNGGPPFRGRTRTRPRSRESFTCRRTIRRSRRPGATPC